MLSTTSYWVIKTALKSFKTWPGLTCLQYVCLSILDILQLFIYRKTVEIRAHTVCLHDSLKCHCFNVRSACDWQYGQSLSSDLQRRRQIRGWLSLLQAVLSSTVEMLTPLRCIGAAQEAAQVQEMPRQVAAAQLVLVAISLNHVREVMLWNSCGSFMSANPRQDNWFGWFLEKLLCRSELNE